MFRNILHLRIDAFPVAVERLRDPLLWGKPVVVCPRHSPRSQVFSASTEARQEGVFEGLPLTKALRRCKRLCVLPPDEKFYREVSGSISSLLGKYSPLVEPGYWGRFYVDLTGTSRIFGDIQDSAFRIRSEIEDSVHLNSTLGIASNKLVSGVAARVVAAYGNLYAVPQGSEAPFLAPLQVRMLPAVKSKVERELLSEFNIRVVQQLAAIPVIQLALVFGKLGPLLHRQALGIDERPVLPPKSKPFILEEVTLAQDTNNDRILLAELYGMMERACRRMRAGGILSRKVWLHIRYSDGVDATRCLRIKNPVTTDSVLFRVLEPFFLKTDERRQRVRYFSITFTDLISPPAQLSLFDTPSPYKKEEALVTALDRVRSKYGKDAVRLGRTEKMEG
jgi:DNA polymerase-4